LNRLVKMIAATALAVAMPAAAFAANSNDTTPKTNPPGTIADPTTMQGEYLQNSIDVKMTLLGACTQLQSDPTIDFSNVQPDNTATPRNSTLFNVYPTCGKGIAYRIFFQGTNNSTTNGPCNLDGPGGATVAYDIYWQQNQGAGQGACLANNESSGPGVRSYNSTSGAGNGTGGQQDIVFAAQITQKLDGTQGAIPPSGSYTDTLNVYLEF
jgi:spore coat protein U-like protein